MLRSPFDGARSSIKQEHQYRMLRGASGNITEDQAARSDPKPVTGSLSVLCSISMSLSPLLHNATVGEPPEKNNSDETGETGLYMHAAVEKLVQRCFSCTLARHGGPPSLEESGSASKTKDSKLTSTLVLLHSPAEFSMATQLTG